MHTPATAATSSTAVTETPGYSAATPATGAPALVPRRVKFGGRCCRRCAEEKQLVASERVGEYVLRGPHHQGDRELTREATHLVSDL